MGTGSGSPRPKALGRRSHTAAELGSMPGEWPSETLGLYHNFIVLNLICVDKRAPPTHASKQAWTLGVKNEQHLQRWACAGSGSPGPGALGRKSRTAGSVGGRCGTAPRPRPRNERPSSLQKLPEGVPGSSAASSGLHSAPGLPQGCMGSLQSGFNFYWKKRSCFAIWVRQGDPRLCSGSPSSCKRLPEGEPDAADCLGL